MWPERPTYAKQGHPRCWWYIGAGTRQRVPAPMYHQNTLGFAQGPRLWRGWAALAESGGKQYPLKPSPFIPVHPRLNQRLHYNVDLPLDASTAPDPCARSKKYPGMTSFESQGRSRPIPRLMSPAINHIKTDGERWAPTVLSNNLNFNKVIINLIYYKL